MSAALGPSGQGVDLAGRFAAARYTRLTPRLGCELDDVDLSIPLEVAEAASLRGLFDAHGVLVVRDQRLDREAHKALGRVFGELHTHPSREHTRGDRHIFKVAADADTPFNNGGSWHSDLSCSPQPPLASLLLLR